MIRLFSGADLTQMRARWLNEEGKTHAFPSSLSKKVSACCAGLCKTVRGVNINGYLDGVTALYISQTTSHLTGRAKVVSRKCIRMFSVRPFIRRQSTCSVVLLTARGPPTQDREAEADAGLHLMGTSDRCKHKMGWLSRLRAPLCC